MEPMQITISLELANQILGYLGKRPFEEVYTLIERFQKEHKENADLAKGVQFPAKEKLEAEEVNGTT